MNVGTTNEGEELQGTLDIFQTSKMKDNTKARARFLMGPFRRRLVHYPTIVKNDEGDFIFSSRTITADPLDPFNHFFSPIAKFEKKMRKDNGEDKPSARLKAATTFFYIGYLLGAEERKLEIFEIKWSQQEQLNEIMNRESEAHPGKLMYGPQYLYDLILKKTRDPNKSKFTGTNYKLDIADPEFLVKHEIMNQIPTNIPKGKITEQFEELVARSFTEEEMAFLNSSAGDTTEKVAKANDIRKEQTEEAIYKQLEEAPLNLFAVTNEKFEFFNPTKLFEFVQQETQVKLLEQGFVQEVSIEAKARAERETSNKESGQEKGSIETATFVEEGAKEEVKEEEVNPKNYNL